MYELGKYYLTNNDDPENNAEATQWLTGAAQRGRIEAIFLLAEMYLYGTKYIAKDENHALHWYEKSGAFRGRPKRSTRLRQCMLRGRALKLIINKHGCG